MTSRTWHKGPPPHVGWWNASWANDLTAWRWWNGKHWSHVAYPEDSEFFAEISAQSQTPHDYIEWTNYYPKNARVPRINPGKNK
jgi:hypothetical protein